MNQQLDQQGGKQVPPRSQNSRPNKPRNAVNKKKTQQATIGAAIGAAAIIIAAIIGGVFLLLANNNKSESTPTPIPSPSVPIISPAEGSKVPGSITVRGTAHNIPQNEELWLFIQPDGVTSYFPQQGPITVLSDGTWSVTAYIGQQEGSADVGKKFVLTPVLFSQNNREAKDAIQKYLDQPGPVYKGIEPLPSGIQLMSPVSVVRA